MRICRTNRPAFRGAAGRRAVRAGEEWKQRGHEALMHTMVTCTTLWAGFWLQFLIGFLYNSPAIHVFSRGNWYAPHVQFYLPAHGPLSISLAESFAWLSGFGSFLALVGVCHWTRGVRGRWRMRILVAGFAGFLSLWSLAALAGEEAAWEYLENRRAQIQRELRKSDGGDLYLWLKSDLEATEQVLEMRPAGE